MSEPDSIDMAIESFYRAVFEHAFRVGQEFPDEKSTPIDPCSEEDKQMLKQAIADYVSKARLDELDRLIDINDKTFSRWSQKDIAHFFSAVGKRYRELQAELGEK